ncbi:CaiB/BaiF CoA transferase family protein [Thermodesulfobacteriota bacterium]
MAIALEGMKVIEATSAVGAPMCGRLLADFGADVIRIESAVAEATIQGKPRYSRGEVPAEINYIAQNIGCNKRNMTLDLASEAGREIMYTLLKGADVFLSNFRPRILEKLKLEYDILSKLNPRLICATLTGFGHKGPDKDKPAFGATAADPRSGFIHMLTPPGQDPPETPIAYADFITGMTLAYGISMALLIRERTGVAQTVDASLYNSIVWALTSSVGGTLINGRDGKPTRRRDRGTPLRNCYQTKDGRWLYMMMMPKRGDIWSKFCEAIDREDLENHPMIKSPSPSTEDNVAMFDILEKIFLSKTLEEWKPCLNGIGANWSYAQNLVEVVNDPQARANDFFAPVDHPLHGHIEIVGNPVKLNKTPATVRRHAPEIGEDTEEILSELGYSAEQIEEFKKQQVIV